LAGIKGRFVLSINDRPEVRELFKEFQIKSVSTTYSASKTGSRKDIRELVIMNFKATKTKQ